MRSNKTSTLRMRRIESGSNVTQRAFEAVKISDSLIAFYPQAIHRAQPYVILLDPDSGILKRLDLETAK